MPQDFRPFFQHSDDCSIESSCVDVRINTQYYKIVSEIKDLPRLYSIIYTCQTYIACVKKVLRNFKYHIHLTYIIEHT